MPPFSLKKRIEESCGIIPINVEHTSVFLVKHREGFWTFPKGHRESFETQQTCAFRELYEETGLSVVSLLQEHPFFISYHFTNNQNVIEKQVFFFPAIVTGVVHIQKSELLDGMWISCAQAYDLFIHKEEGSLLKKTEQLLSTPP